jgi:hypothetical protein
MAQTQGFFSRLCCPRRSLAEDHSATRLKVAKDRWNKVKKLRLLFMSLSAAKAETNDRARTAYFGSIKDEVDEESRENKRAGIIYPHTLTWEVIQTLAAVLILYFACVTPFRIGFGTAADNQRVIEYELVFDAGLLLYLILTFFMAYIEDIEVVDEYGAIAGRYFRGLFVPDLVSCLPLYLWNPNFMWLKVFRLLRVGQICDLLDRFLDFLGKTWSTETQQLFNLNTKRAISHLIHFATYVAVTCHCIACLWHYVAMMQEGLNWKQGVVMTNTEAYVVALYWTMVTFTTVGYGDITPKTDLEIVVTMIVEFVGILFFAYLMGTVSSIVSNWNQRALALSQRESDLEKWLMMVDKNRPDKRLHPSMHNSIRNYFVYIWKYDHSFLIKGSPFMWQMPAALRHDLMKHLFSDEIAKYRSFFDACDEDFAYQLVLSMFPRKFRKLEGIVPEGQVSSELYFVESGSVLLSLEKIGSTCLQIDTGGFIGDFEAIFGVDVEGFYQAGFQGCEIYCVKNEDLTKLLKAFPYTFEVVASRAYKRLRYYEAVTQLTIMERQDPG